MTDEDELLAAELAFGLHDDGEREAALARLASDPEFAAAHARWQALGVALIRAGEEAPRPSLWPAIEARLPANDSGVAGGNARPWKIATFAASLAALILGAVALDRPAPAPIVRTPITPPLVAVLTGKDTGAVVAVSFDAATGRLTLAPAALDPAERSAELWVIPAGGKPRSLGVMAAGGSSWRGAPAAAAGAIAPGATLAISLEPAGGSPTGQPTGPVILTGIVKPA